MTDDPGSDKPYLHPQVILGAHASGSARIFQSAESQVIYEATPPYRLSSFPPAPEQLRSERLAVQPSRLLRVNFEIVPFAGRETEVRQLTKWRNAPTTKTAVQLIYAPGGQGKTRFVAQLARLWVNDEWLTFQAFAHDDLGGPQLSETLQASNAAGILIVADYAERWGISDLLSLLRDVASCGGQVRVLLLTRTAETWWDTLAYHLDKDLDVDAETMSLPPLGENPEDREKLFADARDRFAQLLSVRNPEYILPPPSLESDHRYGLVLTIHMAALAKVVAHASREVPPQDSAELSAFLLAREREHWRTLHVRREEPIRTAPEIMAQIVYTATLTGPLARGYGLEALRLAEVESVGHPGQLLKDHARCYPPGESGVVLEPLYPDRLGEDFVALTTPGHTNQVYRPDPWAGDALTRILSQSSDIDQLPPWTPSAMNLISEIATRWPHMAPMTRAGVLPGGRHHRRL
jgi:hypothetical protein